MEPPPQTGPSTAAAKSDTPEYVPTFPKVDNALKEIRLLVLLPDADPSAPVRCEYTKTSLQGDTAAYETISYAWGRVEYDAVITIDGCAMKTTKVVVQLLQRLRGSDHRRTLWIDMLCINQGDDDDKGSQVQMMNLIYTKCTACAVWLGAVDAALAAKAREMYSFVQCLARCPHLEAALSQSEETRDRALDLFVDDSDDTKRRVGDLRLAFAAFMDAPWWTRIWTVQECILPAHALVYWGSSSALLLPPLPWEAMKKTCDVLLSLPAGRAARLTELGLWDGFNKFTSSICGLDASHCEEQLDLLWRWRFRDATDARDKVFGLMGLPSRSESIPTGRACNYSLGAAALYRRVAVELLQARQTLQPLIGRAGECSSLRPAVPTWVTDWRRHTTKHGYDDCWEKKWVWDNAGFCADRGLRNLLKPRPRFQDDDDRVLVLEGLLVDRLAVVEDVAARRHVPPEEKTVRSSHWLNLWAGLIAQHTKKPLPGDWQDIPARLYNGNLVHDHPEEKADRDTWNNSILGKHAMFITKGGRYGVGPMCSAAGQEVWVVGGSRFPLILESLPGSEETGLDKTFVSECYIYGMMKGEAVAASQAQPVEIRLH